jgi:hypothetical protein
MGVVAGAGAVLAMLVPAAASAAVTWTPKTVDFGPAAVGFGTDAQTVTVTATCAEHFGAACPKPGRFTPEVSFDGDSGEFSQRNDCGTGIFGNTKVDGICRFTLRFNPTQLGARASEVTLGYNTTEANIRTPVIVSLEGTGVEFVSQAKRCKKKGKKRSASAAKKKCKKRKRK